MERKLPDLLKPFGIRPPSSLEDLVITNLSSDSRLVCAGDLFFGLPGELIDGGVFWPDALSAGATAAVISRSAAEACPPSEQDPVVICPEPIEKYVGEISSEFWGNPSSKMALIGVTGTNGKTTIVHLIEHLTTYIGKSSALFGTLANRWPSHDERSIHTTNFASTLQRNLAEALINGVDIAAMEVSSHALSQRRVAGCHFSGAIFTNLSQDHLDYHSSMESYFEAKALLFDPYYLNQGRSRAIVNVDNHWGQVLAGRLKDRCWISSLNETTTSLGKSDLFFSDITMSSSGVTGRLHTPYGSGSFSSHLIGRFNLMNLLQAVGALIQQGLPLNDLLEGLSSFPGVSGRMECVTIDSKKYDKHLPIVLVDYAHTPDGLKNALVAVRNLCSGSLICVFGCGGDRDQGKRAQMGKIAADLADKIILTSDNPRTEDPKLILRDIELGIPISTDFEVFEDRSSAIECAIMQANVNDIVLIAGKGHEDYQIIGKERVYFDDREQAKHAIKLKIRQ